MLELGYKSKNIMKNSSKLLTTLTSIKYSLKEKKLFSHINILIKKKGEDLQNLEDIDLSLGKMISNNDLSYDQRL